MSTARENIVTEDALNDIEYLPVLEELDKEPTLDELSEALGSLVTGKALRKDGIPAEVLKYCKRSLIKELHEILCLCWREGEVPQHIRDANIVTLYKNKGDRIYCNNYRGISLVSIVGKLCARIPLKSLQVLAERVYLESQCGFRVNWSTIDMVLSLRQLQEKCREQRQPLFVAFIDLTKAFALVSRDGLFKILPKIGCPPRLFSIIRSFHDNMKGAVAFGGSTQTPSTSETGLRSRSDPVRNRLCRHAETSLRLCHRGHLPQNQIGWKALQPFQTKSKVHGRPWTSTSPRRKL